VLAEHSSTFVCIMWNVALTSQAEAIMPQPASTVSFSRSTLPINGGMIKAMVTRERFRGKTQHPTTPSHRKATCTAPDGAV
jgi:hypothetical protein